MVHRCHAFLLALSARVSPVVSGLAIGAGVAALVGWGWEVEVLRRGLAGAVSMNPVTALLFILAGISLALHGCPFPGARRLWAQGLALVVMGMGVWRLLAYGVEGLGRLDQWLFADQLAGDLPGRVNEMSPNAALGFVILGLGLLGMNWTTRRGFRPTEVCALLLNLLSFLALLGYLYEVPWLYGVVTFIPMALPTAGVFGLLSAGLLFARRDRGWMRLILSSSPGGVLVRQLFPLLVPALVLLGWLRLAGERRGLFVAEMGTTLYTIVAILLVGGLIWWSARTLHHTDKARRQAEHFFTLSLDMLCIAERDGKLRRINPAFAETLGLTMEEMLGRPFLEFVHPDDREKTEKEAQQVMLGQPTKVFENRYCCRDGTYRWFWWQAQFYEDDGLIFATGRDVTEQKRAQREFRLLNEALHERATQLDASNQELEAFSYSVSHDLRAPLRGISGFAQALEERTKGALDETSQSYLLRVRRAADRMGYLIDDLLKLSRLTRTEMRLETVDLTGQALGILTLLKQRDPQRQVEWRVQGGMTLQADPALMQVLMENLLENAWKFTSKNPQALIVVEMSVGEAGEKICHVRDNGVGFDMRYASKLFGAFQRLHSMVEFPGTGIGLATVQRVVRRHGGRVWADSEMNVGTTFSFVV